MKRKIKFGLVAVMLLLFAGIASAGELPPPIPADYSGTVIANGTPYGSKVLAQVVNDTGYVYQTGIFDIVSGRYGKPVNGNPLLVAPPDVSFSGKIIKFYAKADGKYCKAAQEDTFSQGKTGDPFNLTVVVSPCVEPLGVVITPTPTTPTPTPTATSSRGTGSSGSSGSGSSGGGSGGGGVTSGETFANIAKSETRDGTLFAGKPVAFTFKSTELAIHQILITGKENENDVTVRVESLKDKSSLVSRPAPGTVYQNTNVWVNSKRISAVTLKFRVTNAWITSGSVQKENIKLLRWSDNDWKSLDTTVLNSDNNFTYFEAQSAGLSSFAVSAVKEGQVPADTSQPGSTATTPISNASTPKKPTPGFGMLAAVIVVSAIYLLRRRDG